MIDKTVKLGKHELISVTFFTGGTIRIQSKYGNALTLEEDEVRDFVKIMILGWDKIFENKEGS